MKKILFLIPLIFVGAKVSSEQLIKPAKEEITFEIKKPAQLINCPPAACAGFSPENIITTVSQNDVAPYVHCTSCRMGVFLGNENEEKKCTYCGVKEHYEPR
jgi:hypothetical protein